MKAKKKKQSMTEWCKENGLDHKLLYKRDIEEVDGMKYMTFLKICEVLGAKPSNVLRRINR